MNLIRKTIEFVTGSGPGFSADRAHYSPEYKKPGVTKLLEQKVTIRMRMAATTDGSERVTWIPEQHYTRDADTCRINVFKDIRDAMHNADRDRIVIMGIVPSWACNEITDAGCGHLIISIERLFSGVATHARVEQLLRDNQQSQQSSPQQEQGENHPDYTGVVKLFIAAGQRGKFDSVHENMYTSRISEKGVGQFGAAEDIMLMPASRPTMRDIIVNSNDDDDSKSTATISLDETNPSDLDNVDNDNNAPLVPKVASVPKVLAKADFEIMSIKHPFMVYLDEFGDQLRNEHVLKKSDVLPLDVNQQSLDVRTQIDIFPTMYRVDQNAAERARAWLCRNVYDKMRYTRLTDTGLRVSINNEQSHALYTLYRDVLLNRPQDAPCVTLILHVDYIMLKSTNRDIDLANKAEL